MSWTTSILIVNFASTWFMVGLIWLVQIVHYPLFEDVGPDRYSRYHQRHQNSISWIVGPVMLAELVTSAWLIALPESEMPRFWAWTGLALVLAIWASTAFLQVPCHGKLATGFDSLMHRRLVLTNWLRTVAWTIRGLILAAIIASRL